MPAVRASTASAPLLRSQPPHAPPTDPGGAPARQRSVPATAPAPGRRPCAARGRSRRSAGATAGRTSDRQQVAPIAEIVYEVDRKWKSRSISAGADAACLRDVLSDAFGPGVGRGRARRRRLVVFERSEDAAAAATRACACGAATPSGRSTASPTSRGATRRGRVDHLVVGSVLRRGDDLLKRVCPARRPPAAAAAEPCVFGLRPRDGGARAAPGTRVLGRALRVDWDVVRRRRARGTAPEERDVARRTGTRAPKRAAPKAADPPRKKRRRDAPRRVGRRASAPRWRAEPPGTSPNGAAAGAPRRRRPPRPGGRPAAAQREPAAAGRLRGGRVAGRALRGRARAGRAAAPSCARASTTSATSRSCRRRRRGLRPARARRARCGCRGSYAGAPVAVPLPDAGPSCGSSWPCRRAAARRRALVAWPVDVVNVPGTGPPAAAGRRCRRPSGRPATPSAARRAQALVAATPTRVDGGRARARNADLRRRPRDASLAADDFGDLASRASGTDMPLALDEPEDRGVVVLLNLKPGGRGVRSRRGRRLRGWAPGCSKRARPRRLQKHAGEDGSRRPRLEDAGAVALEQERGERRVPARRRRRACAI